MDSDSAESSLDSVEYRISQNPVDSAESESLDSVVHYYLQNTDLRSRINLRDHEKNEPFHADRLHVS